MKFLGSRSAGSLGHRIALHEAALTPCYERLALKAAETSSYNLEIRSRGVSASRLDSVETITETAAVLSWVADRLPNVSPSARMPMACLTETLTHISGQINKSHKTLVTRGAAGTNLCQARRDLANQYKHIADHLDHAYLLGPRFTVADAYFFATLRWAKHFGVTIADPLPEYFERLMARESVCRALAEEEHASASSLPADTLLVVIVSASPITGSPSECPSLPSDRAASGAS